jgi:transcriptional regulator GlxA family with amidase domain
MAPIQFGILMVPYQTLDVAGPVDILSSCSKDFFRNHIGADDVFGFEPSQVDRAVDIQFHHIGNTMDPVELTAGFRVCPTTTCDNCPPLDYLLVGGPDPTRDYFTEAFTTLLRAHVAAGKVLFTTCSGAVAIAPSGILDGKRATTNHEILDFAKAKFPNVKWVKEQWVVDGNIWTAGGACAGMDMMAHWVAQNYDADIVKIGLATLDFEPRDINKKVISA